MADILIPGPMGPQGVDGVPGQRGAVGPQGIQGQAGQRGVQGIQGPQGVPGVNGINGTNGAAGLPGTRIWPINADLSFPTATSQGIKPNDYVLTPGGTLYLYNGDNIVNPVPLTVTGPQGPQGPKGDPGPAGPAGANGRDGASPWQLAQDGTIHTDSLVTISNDLRIVYRVSAGTFSTPNGVLTFEGGPNLSHFQFASVPGVPERVGLGLPADAYQATPDVWLWREDSATIKTNAALQPQGYRSRNGQAGWAGTFTNGDLVYTYEDGLLIKEPDLTVSAATALQAQHDADQETIANLQAQVAAGITITNETPADANPWQLTDQFGGSWSITVADGKIDAAAYFSGGSG